MAEKEGVKLLGMWASPFSRRIEMALKLKGVPYEYVEEDLPNKSPLLLELNPVHKKIPVLVHDGNSIAESLIILEYIDETWKNYPLLPQDPYQRAMARFWARFVDEFVVGKGFLPMLKADSSSKQKIVEELQDLIKLLEKELVGKHFFGGETVGFLDIAISSMIPFFLTRAWEAVRAVEVISEENFPEFNRWMRNLLEIYEVKECIPPKEKHVEHMKMVAEIKRSS